jgi:hypothetical protein
VLLPVIEHAVNPSGNRLDFVITAFVCVQISQMDDSGSVDWKGTLVKCASNGHHDGPTPPSIPSAFTPTLVE